MFQEIRTNLPEIVRNGAILPRRGFQENRIVIHPHHLLRDLDTVRQCFRVGVGPAILDPRIGLGNETGPAGSENEDRALLVREMLLNGAKREPEFLPPCLIRMPRIHDGAFQFRFRKRHDHSRGDNLYGCGFHVLPDGELDPPVWHRIPVTVTPRHVVPVFWGHHGSGFAEPCSPPTECGIADDVRFAGSQCPQPLYRRLRRHDRSIQLLLENLVAVVRVVGNDDEVRVLDVPSHPLHRPEEILGSGDVQAGVLHIVPAANLHAYGSRAFRIRQGESGHHRFEHLPDFVRMVDKAFFVLKWAGNSAEPLLGFRDELDRFVSQSPASLTRFHHEHRIFDVGILRETEVLQIELTKFARTPYPPHRKIQGPGNRVRR